MKKVIFLVIYMGIFSGCSALQKEYKPLYQVKPIETKFEEKIQ